MSIPKLNENELSNVTQPAGGQVGIQTQVFLTHNSDQKNKKKKRKGNGTSTYGSLSGGIRVCSEDEQKSVVGGAGDTYGAGGMKCQGELEARKEPGLVPASTFFLSLPPS